MNEPGDIRRRDDGTFEYLRTQSMSLKNGIVEQWEPVATHAAKHMPLPQAFRANLRAAGYTGGHTLFDLLLAEGWTPPDRSYIELPTGEVSEAERVSRRAAEFIEPPKPTPGAGE